MARKRYIKKKKYRLRKKRPFYKSKIFWSVFLGLIFLGGIVYLAFFSSFFQIKAIEVMGAEKVSPQKVRSIAREFMGQNFLFASTRSIFLVPRKKIQKALLEKFIQISEVKTKRKLPDKVIVEIKERKPVAILCNGEDQKPRECFFVDREGVLFEKISFQKRGDYLLIENKNAKPGLALGEKGIFEDTLRQFLTLKNYFQKELKVGLRAVFPESEEKLIAKTDEGWQAYFNLKNELKKQLRNLKLFLEKEILPKREKLEYIDLRFGNKLYYKFRNSND